MPAGRERECVYKIIKQIIKMTSALHKQRHVEGFNLNLSSNDVNSMIL